MNRVKEIQDKEKAPKLDVSASKRFVKSALWQAAQSKTEPDEKETTGSSGKYSRWLQPDSFYHLTGNEERIISLYIMLLDKYVVYYNNVLCVHGDVNYKKK